MNSECVGKTVSLDCGSLGFFQGVIKGVHLDEQTITIKNVFQNGIPSKMASITLKAQDIKDLKFLEDSSKASSNGPEARSTVQVAKKRQRPVAENLASNSAMAAAASNLQHKSAFTQSPHRSSPRKGFGDPFSGPSFHAPRETQRTPSARRDRNNTQLQRNEDCFGSEIFHREDFTQEFDFEKNLALFDKRLVFEEISASNQPDVIRLVDINRRKTTPVPAFEGSEPKYRNDQNVIDAAPVEYRQIKTGEKENAGEYVTDTGLVVPSIALSLRDRLMAAAEARGFSRERITELVARSGTELSIQLLGGARRLTPANSHQFPLAVILSGPGKSGAYGLAIARHLAAQGVRTVAYVPEMSVYPSGLASELSLYELCCEGGSNKNNMLTCSLAELPKTPVDLVVMALDDHDMFEQERRQTWHRGATKWSEDCRAPILAVDPVPNTASQAKASLLPGLPIWHAHNSAGKVYLVNLAFPAKVYKDVGIAFVSPFGAKTYIGLHSSE